MSQDKDKDVVEIVKEVKQDILYADEFVYEVCTSFKEHFRYDDEDYIKKNNITYQDKVHIKNLVNEKVDELQTAFTQEYSAKFQPYLTALNDIENTLTNNVNGGSPLATLTKSSLATSSRISPRMSAKGPRVCRPITTRKTFSTAPKPDTSISHMSIQMPTYKSENQVRPNYSQGLKAIQVNPSISETVDVNLGNVANENLMDCSLVDEELITYINEVIDDTYDLLGERNMTLARQIISLFYDVDLMEQAIENVKNRQQGGKLNRKRKLKQQAGSLGEMLLGKSMDLAMGKLKGLLTEKTKEFKEKEDARKSTSKNASVKDAENKNEVWFSKFFKQSAELTNLNKEEVDAEYQRLVEEFNRSTLGKVVDDFKGYPFFSQPFYVRSFLWRLLLKGCFGRRYMMFGKHKGFVIDTSVFYRMETKSEECDRRKAEIKQERENLMEQVQNLSEDFDMLYGFSNEPTKVSKLTWQIRKKMLHKVDKIAPVKLSQSQELALKTLDYDLIKRYAKVVIDCEITHPIKQKPKEEANSKFKPNEDEDKKKLQAISENALKRSGNEDLLKDMKQLAAKPEQIEKSLIKPNVKVNATPQSPATNNITNVDPEKIVSGVKDKVFDSIKDLLVDMSGHVLKTLNLSGFNLQVGLRVVGQQFLEILLQVLPGPLINIASALGAFPVGIVEVGLGLLIMVVVHSYSYYKKRAHMLKAQLNILQKQSVNKTNVVPFEQESFNVGYKVKSNKSSSIVFPVSQSFDSTNAMYTDNKHDKVVVFKYPIENPLFKEFESLINQSEEVFEDESLANINTDEIDANDLVQYFYPDMQGGKRRKKKKLSKKQHNEITEFLQKYTSKELKWYLDNKNIRLNDKRDKQSVINAIVQAHFVVH